MHFCQRKARGREVPTGSICFPPLSPSAYYVVPGRFDRDVDGIHAMNTTQLNGYVAWYAVPKRVCGSIVTKHPYIRRFSVRNYPKFIFLIVVFEFLNDHSNLLVLSRNPLSSRPTLNYIKFDGICKLFQRNILLVFVGFCNTASPNVLTWGPDRLPTGPTSLGQETPNTSICAQYEIQDAHHSVLRHAVRLLEIPF